MRLSLGVLLCGAVIAGPAAPLADPGPRSQPRRPESRRPESRTEPGRPGRRQPDRRAEPRRPEPPGLALRLRAPAGCPSLVALRELVAEHLGESATRAPSLRVDLVVWRTAANRWLARLDARGEAGGHRELEGGTCREVIDAAALVIALAVENDGHVVGQRPLPMVLEGEPELGRAVPDLGAIDQSRASRPGRGESAPSRVHDGSVPVGTRSRVAAGTPGAASAPSRDEAMPGGRIAPVPPGKRIASGDGARAKAAPSGGPRGSAEQGGLRGSAEQGGPRGSAEQGGPRGSADQGGPRGSAEQGGPRGSADQGGDGRRGSGDHGGSRGSVGDGRLGSAESEGLRGSADQDGRLGSAEPEGLRGSPDDGRRAAAEPDGRAGSTEPDEPAGSDEYGGSTAEYDYDFDTDLGDRPGRSRRQPIGASLRAGGAGESGTLPQAAAGVEAALAVWNARHRLELSGAYWPAQAARVGPGQNGAMVGLWTSAVRGCRTLSIAALCGGGEIGRMTGRAMELPDRRDGAAWWGALSGSVWLRRPIGRAAIYAGLEGLVPVTRPRFELDDETVLYRPGPLAGRAMLGLELSLF